MIFFTDLHCMYKLSNYFIINQISFMHGQYFLLPQIFQSSQNNVQIISFLYKQSAPKIQTITGDRRLLWPIFEFCSNRAGFRSTTSINYCYQAVWAYILFLGSKFLVLWLITLPQKVPFLLFSLIYPYKLLKISILFHITSWWDIICYCFHYIFV